MMKKSTRDEWVAGLRSGDYAQGCGSLLAFDGEEARYCCLGVLTEQLHGEGIWDEVPCGRTYWAIDDTDLDSLVHMNDSERKTFAEIADWIEENIDVV